MDLDRYSELHGNTWGVKVNAETLIPHMLEAFIAQFDVFVSAYNSSDRVKITFKDVRAWHKIS